VREGASGGKWESTGFPLAHDMRWDLGDGTIVDRLVDSEDQDRGIEGQGICQGECQDRTQGDRMGETADYPRR
jgi:hypothetical protein